MSNNTPTATNGSSSPERILKATTRLLNKWFVGPTARVPMLQAIVGGLIANLIFGAILGLTGAIHIAFSWSWSFYIMVLWIIAAIFAVFGVVFAVSYHNDPGDDRSKAGWGESLGVAAAFFLGSIIIWPFIVTLIDALHISIYHATSGCNCR